MLRYLPKSQILGWNFKRKPIILKDSFKSNYFEKKINVTNNLTTTTTTVSIDLNLWMAAKCIVYNY